jgi:hypothetical protein
VPGIGKSRERKPWDATSESSGPERKTHGKGQHKQSNEQPFNDELGF